MYHGVGVNPPSCVPADIKAMAERDCAAQIKGIGAMGALPGVWAQYNPCNLVGLPPCTGGITPRFFFGGGSAQEPIPGEEPGGEEPGEEPGGEEDRSGAFAVGGILLLLVAAGGGYYLYRRSKRRAA